MKHVTAKVVILTIVVAVHILVLWLLTLLNRQPEMTARDFQEAVYIRDSKPPELQTPVDPCRLLWTPRRPLVDTCRLL